MELPVLINHQHEKQIGSVLVENGNLIVEFDADIRVTKEDCLDIFGGAGLQVLDMTKESGKLYIRKAKIIEFSLCPPMAIAQDSKL